MLDALRGRVIAISVAGHAADCRITLTRRGFSPRTRRSRTDLALETGPYGLYLLARGLVGADEPIHAGRLEIAGDATMRGAFLQVLAGLDWSALAEGSRKFLEGLATLHMRCGGTDPARGAGHEKRPAITRRPLKSLVEMRGIEPLTFALRTRRSPS